MLIQCYQKALFPSHTNQKKQQKLQRITAKKTPQQNIISILCLRFCHIKWSVCAFNFIYLFYFAFSLSASVVVLCKCVCFSNNFSVRLAVIDVHLVGLSLVDVRFFFACRSPSFAHSPFVFVKMEVLLDVGRFLSK